MADYDVVVIGAGAAGLMCAIEAGRRGRRTLVADHANKVGKKILLSGGGRCNFTNIHAAAENFLSGNPHFCKSALARYTPYQFIEMVERHGIPYHEKKLGQLFCDRSAKDIVGMLMRECEAAGVVVRTRYPLEVLDGGPPFHLTGPEGPLRCESLVVASGGLSFPKMGASGFGHRLARRFGLDVTPLQPALVPFTCEGPLRELAAALAGVSVDSELACGDGVFRENILFTHRGISGPAALQVSSYWSPGQSVSADLLPGRDALAWLQARKAKRPRARLGTILSEALPARLVERFPGAWSRKATMQTLSDRDLASVAASLSDWRFVPAGTEGYRTAEVTLGGVSTEALSSRTLESRAVPGLHFIGELVDVTGWLGGYNFQWAWASGYAAGQVV
ncbi:NAD(P)/FAD-dependent oxidoreductase [Ectothiorhodospiraceae bacterium WFHF3C12]|nr:NAD(P)/FAD-dependent oxidoreductase [Ectothiorhodospiraceae bacterium WFHF3C12]